MLDGQEKRLDWVEISNALLSPMCEDENRRKIRAGKKMLPPLLR